jgi:hypothetical protein
MSGTEQWREGTTVLPSRPAAAATQPVPQSPTTHGLARGHPPSKIEHLPGCPGYGRSSPTNRATFPPVRPRWSPDGAAPAGPTVGGAPTFAVASWTMVRSS